MNGPTLALATMLLLAIGSPLSAQEPAPRQEPAPQQEPEDAPAVAEDEERPPPPEGDAPPIESRGGAEDVFVPSERVRADASIAFPVDI